MKVGFCELLTPTRLPLGATKVAELMTTSATAWCQAWSDKILRVDVRDVVAAFAELDHGVASSASLPALCSSKSLEGSIVCSTLADMRIGFATGACCKLALGTGQCSSARR